MRIASKETAKAESRYTIHVVRFSAYKVTDMPSVVWCCNNVIGPRRYAGVETS
jgi:hypothetical protein